MSLRVVSAPPDDRGRPLVRSLRDSTNRCASQVLLQSTSADQRRFRVLCQRVPSHFPSAPPDDRGRPTVRSFHDPTNQHASRELHRPTGVDQRSVPNTAPLHPARRTVRESSRMWARCCHPTHDQSRRSEPVQDFRLRDPSTGTLSTLGSCSTRERVPRAFRAPEADRLRRRYVTAANSKWLVIPCRLP